MNKEYMRKWRRGERTHKDNGLDYLLDKLEWKDIPGYENYQASPCGQIKSKQRILIRDNGRKHTVPDKVLKKHLDGKGYPQVRVYINKEKFMRSVHKLVFLAWHGPVPIGAIIDHRDGNKLNAHKDNLQPLSNSDNTLKSYQDAYNKGYRQALEDLKTNIKENN